MEPSIILEIVTAVAVILGIAFGLLQLRHYHLSRKREADLLLVNSFQTSEFLDGIWKIHWLSEGLTSSQIEDTLGDEFGMVHLVINTWERMGILVFQREISIDMVDIAFGSQIMLSWRKLQASVADLRDRLHDGRLHEWFQWLAERIAERRETRPRMPTHVAYRDWP